MSKMYEVIVLKEGYTICEGEGRLNILQCKYSRLKIYYNLNIVD